MYHDDDEGVVTPRSRPNTGLFTIEPILEEDFFLGSENESKFSYI